MTPRQARIIEAARRAGLSVERNEQATRWSVKRGSIVIVMFPNGTMLRGDVRIDLAQNMTEAQAMSLLGLAR